MKKLLLAMTLFLPTLSAALAQAPYKVYTSPKLPMRETLERMNLVLAWNARVNVDGNRDGIFSVQFIPGRPNQLVVQTFKGAVFLYDADSGDLIWKTQVGIAYWIGEPVTWNSQSIFVTRRTTLFVLNRFDGSQRVYTYNPTLRQADFGFDLGYTPNAAPVADEDLLYVSLGDRVQAFFIPDFEKIERMKQDKGGAKKVVVKGAYGETIPTGPDSPQPSYYWGYLFGDKTMSSAPLLYGPQVSLLTTDGTLTSVDRFEEGPRKELFEIKLTGRTPAAPGQYHNIAYIGSDDFNLYAINMAGGQQGGQLVWRYIAGAPILRQPHVNDADVYITPDRVGLRRVDRRFGREVWTNRDVQKFLAANLTNVYARDRIGKFYVLDGRRGTTLATHNLMDWTISIANEWTDRIYLAANDGQVICLRHRDLPRPLSMKSREDPNMKKPMEKKEEKKDEEKKEEKKDNAALPQRLPQAIAARHDPGPRIEATAMDRRRWAGR